MKHQSNRVSPLLLSGEDKLVCSIAVCLLQAGHPITLLTEDKAYVNHRIDLHLKDLKDEKGASSPQRGLLSVVEQLRDTESFELAILITEEEEKLKEKKLKNIERQLPSDTIITINSESVPLDILQSVCKHPERLMLLNWTEPAHTTFFLEIVANKRNLIVYTDYIVHLAEQYWKKSPYLIKGNSGIRSRIMAAMIREAFFLVEKGYASVEDIDRAFRNDAGYYLPFCGSFRYMDLMGPYAYGLVMKELNPELDCASATPPFFDEIIAEEEKGIQEGSGFYSNDEEEIENFDEQARRFSYQIQELIEKYPFNYKKKSD